MELYLNLELFLKSLPTKLLEDFLSKETWTLEAKQLQGKDWQKELEKLSQPEIERLTNFCRDVEYLTNEKGMKSILSACESLGINPETLFKNDKDTMRTRVFRIAVYHTHIFKRAYEFHIIDYPVGNWKVYSGFSLDCELNCTQETLSSLEQYAIQFFKRQGRGTHAISKPIERADKQIIHLSVCNYPTAIAEFEGTELKTLERYPAFDLFFVYEPTLGQLRINNIRLKNQWKAFVQGFCSIAMGLPILPENPWTNRFDLTKPFTPGFQFVIDIDSCVSHIDILQVTLEEKRIGRRHILQSQKANDIIAHYLEYQGYLQHYEIRSLQLCAHLKRQYQFDFYKQQRKFTLKNDRTDPIDQEREDFEIHRILINSGVEVPQ